MSDIENVAEQHEEEIIDYKAKYEEAQKSIEALAAKKDQLYNETKKAKEERARQAEVAEHAKQQQLEAALKNGEFEKLAKHEQQEKEKYLKELTDVKRERRDDKINIAAHKVAVELAKGDANKAELLSDFLARSIGKVADEFGNVDSDVLASVRSQFESEERYKPLLGNSKAVGGSAPGQARSAGDGTKQLSYSDYDRLSPSQKLDFSKLERAGKAKII